MIPIVGGLVGSGIDVASTHIIAKNATSVFIHGELPVAEVDNDVDGMIEHNFLPNLNNLKITP